MYFKLETRITYPKEKANSRMLSFVRVANIIRRTNIHVVYTAVQNNEIKHFVKTNGKSQTAKEGFLDSHASKTPQRGTNGNPTKEEKKRETQRGNTGTTGKHQE